MISSNKFLLSLICIFSFLYADAQDSTPVSNGKNIISFAPVQFTNSSFRGIGIYYEHILDKKGIFSVSFPFALSNGEYAAKELWMYPGLKVYPAGSNKKLSYGIGPSLVIAAGGSVPYLISVYDPQTGKFVPTESAHRLFQLGVMVHNSLNFQPYRRIYTGLEFGVGIPYFLKNESYYYYDEILVQFNFKVGYRF